jgi:hypothetical protein
MARLSNRRIHLTITRTVGQHDFVWVRVAWFAEWGPNQPVIGDETFRSFSLRFLTLWFRWRIFLSISILISENHKTGLSDRRNLLDFQIIY